MARTVGYIGRGFRGVNYGTSESAASKKRKLSLLEDVALAVDQPEVAGLIEGSTIHSAIPNSIQSLFSERLHPRQYALPPWPALPE